MTIKTKRTIYLVYGFNHYEYPCNPIKAFVFEADADKLLREINAYAYENKKPECPSGEATDEEYDAWYKRFQRWVKKHPASDAYNHDGFAVMPLELNGRHTPERPE